MYRYLLFFLAMTTLLWGTPQNGIVVEGNALFHQTGKGLNIHSGDRTIIDWGSFSIDSGEFAHFIQSSKASAVLNRVIGSEKSLINGLLKSNGHVFLVNQQGIVIGKEGVIRAASFTGSTLDLSNDQFLQGKDLVFQGESRAAIVNYGTIHAKTGDVFLLGCLVENQGTIEAPDGTVGFGQGSEIFIAMEGEERLFIRRGIDGSVSNEGVIESAEVEIKASGNPYSLAIRHGGEIEASGVAHRNGRVLLVADQGKTEVSGTIHATSGEVHLLGEEVALIDKAHVDVSGEVGGAVLIGGDDQGANPAIANAQSTYVGEEVTIVADGLSGDGGKVIVWGDEKTHYFGDISCCALGEVGDGGFIEVSAKSCDYKFEGPAHAFSENGKAGTLLLDPVRIRVRSPGGTFPAFPTTAPGTYMPTGPPNTAVINPSAFTGVLSGGTNVIIDSTGAGGGTGNIDFEDSFSWGGVASGTLFVTAFGAIDVQLGVTIECTSGPGGIDMTAQGNTVVAPFSRGIDLTGSSLITVDGDIVLDGTGGNAPAGQNNDGVRMGNGGQVIVNGTGSISIMGTAVSGVDFNDGVIIEDPGTLVQTNGGGSITITGQGAPAGTGENNYGVTIFNSAIVETTAGGDITINGTGGTGDDDTNGIVIISSGSISATLGGTVSLTGIAGACTGSGATGVGLGGGTVSSESGDIIIDGTGDSNTPVGEARGVSLGGSTVTTVSGTIDITGQGGGTNAAANNEGISIDDAQVTATGDGAITMDGTGGLGGAIDGIVLIDSSTIETQGAGSISLTGVGGAGTGTNAPGIAAFTGANVIQATGTGGITLDGTGGSNSTLDNVGCNVSNALAVSTTTGSIDITGVSLSGTDSAGVTIAGSVTTTSGDITIDGTGHTGPELSEGIFIGVGGSVSSTGGNIVMTGLGQDASGTPTGISSTDSTIQTSGAGIISLTTTQGSYFDLGGAGNAYTTTAGDFSITSAADITFSGATSAINTGAGVVSLDAQGGDILLNDSGTITSTSGNADLAATGAIALGVVDVNGANITVDAAGGAVTDGTAAATPNLIGNQAFVRGTSVGSLPLSVNQLQAIGTSGSITLTNDQSLELIRWTTNGTAGVAVETGNNGAIDITADVGPLTVTDQVVANGSGTVDLTASTLAVDVDDNVTSTSGAVTITGDRNVDIGATATVSSSGGIAITGQGNTSGAGIHGVLIDGLVQGSGSGGVTIDGTAGGGNCRGVLINNNVTAATGTIDITGTNTSVVGANNAGVDVTATVSTTSGSIQITGTSGSGSTSRGVTIGGSVTASSNGDITLDGTGNTGAALSEGVLLNGATVTSSGGNLSITGLGQDTSGAPVGVSVMGSSIQTNGSGTVDLSTTGGDFTDSGVVMSTYSTATGTFDLTSVAGILFTGTPASTITTTTGVVTLDAQGGNLTMNNSATVTTNSANADLSATGNIALGVVGVNAANMTVDTTGGTVSDGTGGSTNLTGNNAFIRGTSVTGPIQTSVNQLQTITTNGTASVTNDQALDLVRWTAIGTAGVAIETGNNGAANIITTTGNLTVTDRVVPDGTGAINLTAAGAIVNGSGANSPAILVGDAATLIASTGIGLGTAIGTDLNQLSATNSTSGNIFIFEQSGLTLGNINAVADVEIDANGLIDQAGGTTISAVNATFITSRNGSIGTVNVRNDQNTFMGASQSAGNFTINANGGLSSVTLNGDIDVGGDFTVNSSAFNLNGNAINVQGSTSITPTPTTIVASGPGPDFDISGATLPAAPNPVTVDLSGTNVTGPAPILANAVDVSNTGNAISGDITVTTVSPNLTVTAQDYNLTQSAALILGVGQTLTITTPRGTNFGGTNGLNTGNGSMITLLNGGNVFPEWIAASDPYTTQISAPGDIQLAAFNVYGDLTVTSTAGGVATGLNTGDLVANAAANINLTGTTSAAGVSGVLVDRLVQAAGTGGVTLNGTSSGTNSRGVLINDTVDVTSGNILITGVNNAGLDVDKVGIEVGSGGVLQATTGNITLNGGGGVAAGSGGILLDNATVQITAALSTGTINLNTTAGDFFTANTGSTISSVVGNTSITSVQAINFTPVATAISTTLGTVALDAQGGGINMGDAATITTQNGPATLMATGGDIDLGVINVMMGTIQITSTGGAINDTAAASPNLIGLSGYLSGTQIGPLPTSLTLLQAETTSGDVTVTNNQTLELERWTTNGNPGEAIVTGGGGAVNLTASSGNLIVTDQVIANGAGTVDLTATNGAVTVNANTTSTSGMITIDGNSFLQNSASTISTSADVSVQADTTDINMVSGTTITSSGGAVTLQATTNVRLSAVNASTNIDVTAGSGAISNNSGGTNLTASTATLVADTGIGSGTSMDPTAIGTNLSQLTATNNVSGDIVISEQSGISLGDIAVVNNVNVPIGNFDIRAGDAISQQGGTTIRSIDATFNTSSNLTIGVVNVRNEQNILLGESLTAGDFTVTVPGANSVTLGGDITVGGEFTVVGGSYNPGPFTVRAVDGVNIPGGFNVITAFGMADDFALDPSDVASTGPITINLSGGFETAGAPTSILPAITIDNVNNMMTGTVTVTTYDPNLSFTAKDYNLTQSGALSLNAGQTLTINAPLGANFGGTNPRNGGDGSSITLTNLGNVFPEAITTTFPFTTEITGASLQIQQVETYGDLTLRALTGGITTGVGAQAITVNDVGNATLDAVLGTVTVNRGVTTNTGNVAITGGTGVSIGALGGVTVTSGPAGTIDLTATTGTVSTNGSSQINGQGGTINLTANGLGGGVAINGDSQVINQNGAINLSATGAGSDVTMTPLAEIYSNGGNILLTADNNVAVARVDAGAGDITATATNGSISDSSATPNLPNFVCDAVDLTANTGIGSQPPDPPSTSDIALIANFLSASTVSGDIVISQQDGITLRDITNNTGSFLLEAGGLITQEALTALTIAGELQVETTRATTLGTVNIRNNTNTNLGPSVIAGDYTVDVTGTLDLQANQTVRRDCTFNSTGMFTAGPFSIIQGGLVSINGVDPDLTGTTINAVGAGNVFDLALANPLIAVGDITVNLRNFENIFPNPVLPGNVVVLDSGTNSIAGNITVLTVSPGVPVVQQVDYDLIQTAPFTLNAGQTLNIEAARGSLNPPLGVLNSMWGNSSLNFGLGSNITLDQANDIQGAVIIRDPYDCTINAANNLVMEHVNNYNTLIVTTQSGALTVQGTGMRTAGALTTVTTGNGININAPVNALTTAGVPFGEIVYTANAGSITGVGPSRGVGIAYNAPAGSVTATMITSNCIFNSQTGATLNNSAIAGNFGGTVSGGNLTINQFGAFDLQVNSVTVGIDTRTGLTAQNQTIELTSAGGAIRQVAGVTDAGTTGTINLNVFSGVTGIGPSTSFQTLSQDINAVNSVSGDVRIHNTLNGANTLVSDVTLRNGTGVVNNNRNLYYSQTGGSSVDFGLIMADGTATLLALAGSANMDFSGPLDLASDSIAAANHNVTVGAAILNFGGVSTIVVDEEDPTDIGSGVFANFGLFNVATDNLAIYAVGGPQPPANATVQPPNQVILGTLGGLAIWDQALPAGLDSKYNTSYFAGGDYHGPGFGNNFTPGNGVFGSQVIWYKFDVDFVPSEELPIELFNPLNGINAFELKYLLEFWDEDYRTLGIPFPPLMLIEAIPMPHFYRYYEEVIERLREKTKH